MLLMLVLPVLVVLVLLWLVMLVMLVHQKLVLRPLLMLLALVMVLGHRNWLGIPSVHVACRKNIVNIFTLYLMLNYTDVIIIDSLSKYGISHYNNARDTFTASDLLIACN